MKKVLSIVGGLFLVLALLAAAFLGYAEYEGRDLNASSKAYVEQSVPAIISTWSKDELLKRASPQLRKIVSEKPEQLDQLFQKLSKLGGLRTMGEIKGHSNLSYTSQNGRIVATADYVIAANFENGDGHVSARLVRSPDGQWQFLAFNVSSKLFLQ